MSSSQVVSFDATSLMLDAATTLAALAGQHGAKGTSKLSVKPRDSTTFATAGMTRRPKVNSLLPRELSPPSSPKSGADQQKQPQQQQLAAIPKWKCAFPLQLMEILNDASHAHCIVWLPHGNSFAILKPDVLIHQVLPKYLPLSVNATSPKTPPKFVSFTRKLHRWGFRQETRGPDLGAFTHPLFRRDEPTLCLEMTCDRTGTVRKTLSSHNAAAPSATANALHASSPEASPILTNSASSARRVCIPPQAQWQTLPPLTAAKPTMASSNKVPTKSSLCIPLKAMTVSDDSDDAQSIVTSSTTPLARPPALANGMSSLTTAHAAAAAITKHNGPLTHQALAQRNEVERLEVARHMLFQNYLQALHDKAK